MSKGTVVLTQALLVALLFLVLLLLGPVSAAEHYHTRADAPIHEKFYSKWERPNYPGNSCCHLKDCYATRVKRVGDQWFALRRDFVLGDDGEPQKDANGLLTFAYTLKDPDVLENWTFLPPQIIENNLYPGRKFKSSVDGVEYVAREPLDSPDGQTHVCILQESNFPLCAVLGDAM